MTLASALAALTSDVVTDDHSCRMSCEIGHGTTVSRVALRLLSRTRVRALLSTVLGLLLGGPMVGGCAVADDSDAWPLRKDGGAGFDTGAPPDAAKTDGPAVDTGPREDTGASEDTGALDDTAVDDTGSGPLDTGIISGPKCLYCVGTCKTITADSACYVKCATGTPARKCAFDASATPPCTCI